MASPLGPGIRRLSPGRRPIRHAGASRHPRHPIKWRSHRRSLHTPSAPC